MPALPAYTALPSSDEDKAPRVSASTAPSASTRDALSPKLARELESTADDEHDAAFYRADQPSRRVALRWAVATLCVSFWVLAAGVFALFCSAGDTTPQQLLASFVSCDSTPLEQVQVQDVPLAAAAADSRSWRWWRKRQVDEQDGATGKEEYSTTTYLGDVTTYVKTTRPIINPGGYTFGTLTGYVPVPTTTSTSSATNGSSTVSSAASSAVSSASDSIETSFTRSVTSLPPPPPSAASTHAERVVWASAVASSESSLSAAASAPVSTTTVPPSPPAATARLVKRAAEPEPELDFAEVDYHVLHKRGELFERQDEAEDVQGKEEFSTSTNRQGETFTLVKTTRPIINPGGYTIGTLDGGWVDVAKQTDRPTTTLPTQEATASSVAAEPTAAPAQEGEPVEKRHHDELRRRSVVDFVQ
ncbi:uncharacterized protein JCM10292_006539 [Rhodotorula paludigena]|uniref:uncharacterized protein n=1 Tax=Rhodotorula paludigena TaxID=86838 RepID=UPI00316D5A80